MFTQAFLRAQNEHHTPIYQQRSKQFRVQIRRKEIEQFKSKVRQELLATLCDDYPLLKNINLPQLIADFQSISYPLNQQFSRKQQIINKMFIYASSSQSDHFYALFNSQVNFAKLSKLLDPNFIQQYSQNPRAYLKLLYIASNFCSYSVLIPQSIIQITGQPNFYKQQKRYRIFTHIQSEKLLQIIICQSYSFLLSSYHQSFHFLKTFCCQKGTDSMLSRFINNAQELTFVYWQNGSSSTLLEQKLMKMFLIFDPILRYDQSQKQLLYQGQKQIVNLLLKQLYLLKSQKNIVKRIAQLFKGYFLNQLNSYPQIILDERFTIFFQLFLNDSQQFFWLDMFMIIFGLNFPQENEEKYEEIYSKWIQTFLLPTFQKILRNKTVKERNLYKIFKIVNDLCLYQTFCDMILDQSSIINRICYYSQSHEADIDLKKISVTCLTSIMIMAFDGDSYLRKDVQQLLQQKNIIQNLITYLGDYSDQEFNETLLRAFLAYFRAQVTQPGDQSLRWIKFCELGGKVKLQKCNENVNLLNFVQEIIFEFQR